MGPGNWLAFALLIFAIGYLATLGVPKSRFRVVHWVVAGVFAAHMLVIVVDTREDPTNHNLLPFEFLFLWFAALPGYLGAKIGQWMERFKRAS